MGHRRDGMGATKEQDPEVVMSGRPWVRYSTRTGILPPVFRTDGASVGQIAADITVAININPPTKKGMVVMTGTTHWAIPR